MYFHSSSLLLLHLPALASSLLVPHPQPRSLRPAPKELQPGTGLVLQRLTSASSGTPAEGVLKCGAWNNAASLAPPA